jgi:predicted dehydrogenase/nucleoside-diphosphate-sugar epimerase
MKGRQENEQYASRECCVNTKVAIIGCGQFSRPHIRALHEVKDLEIVAVCDQDSWRAKEVAGLTRDARPYSDLADLLQQEHPDVAHILTPPSTHAALAIQAMRAGCHVLVEKPMALSTEEAERMITAARENGVKLATNHNYLFNPCILQARRLVKQGTIGQIVYVEGFYGLSESGGYTSVSGRSHWAWRLPGSAFTNFLPHLTYLLLEFLPGEVSVTGVTLAQGKMPTELTVLLQGGVDASGVMSISMRARPYTKFLNIYGTKGMIHADLATEVCTLHKAQRLPGMLTKVLFNLEESIQLAVGTVWNTSRVALGSLKRDPGLHLHLREFYASLQDNKELPVSGEAGKRMVEIMEQVWAKAPDQLAPPTVISRSRMPACPQTSAERLFAEKRLPGKILVTGATGFLGYHLVLALARCGAQGVALVRDRGRVSAELEQHAEIVRGDLRDPAALEAAMRDVGIVYHCAAVTKNNILWQTHQDVNIAGTEAVFRAALKVGVQRVIHASSVIVYGLTRSPHDDLISETTSFPDHLDRWAHYMRSKLAADKLAFDYWREAKLPVTVLRLGILYGPGGRSPARGLVQLGPLRLTIGNERNQMPFTYVGNAVDCMLLAAISPEAIGQAYNVVDEPQVTGRDVASQSMEITGERSIPMPVPPFLLSGVARLLELKSEMSHSITPPKLSRFVVASACRNLRYDNRKAREQLGWRSAVSLEEGLRNTLDHGPSGMRR